MLKFLRRREDGWTGNGQWLVGRTRVITQICSMSHTGIFRKEKEKKIVFFHSVCMSARLDLHLAELVVVCNGMCVNIVEA